MFYCPDYGASSPRTKRKAQYNGCSNQQNDQTFLHDDLSFISDLNVFSMDVLK